MLTTREKKNELPLRSISFPVIETEKKNVISSFSPAEKKKSLIKYISVIENRKKAIIFIR
jgi:hypothetical protein